MFLFVEYFGSFGFLDADVAIGRSQNFESEIGMFVGFSQIKRSHLNVFLGLLLILFYRTISFDLSIGTFWTGELVIHKLRHLQSGLTLCVFVGFEVLAFVGAVFELSEDGGDRLDVEMDVG